MVNREIPKRKRRRKRCSAPVYQYLVAFTASLNYACSQTTPSTRFNFTRYLVVSIVLPDIITVLLLLVVVYTETGINSLPGTGQVRKDGGKSYVVRVLLTL